MPSPEIIYITKKCHHIYIMTEKERLRTAE